MVYISRQRCLHVMLCTDVQNRFSLIAGRPGAPQRSKARPQAAPQPPGTPDVGGEGGQGRHEGGHQAAGPHAPGEAGRCRAEGGLDQRAGPGLVGGAGLGVGVCAGVHPVPPVPGRVVQPL